MREILGKLGNGEHGRSGAGDAHGEAAHDGVAARGRGPEREREHSRKQGRERGRDGDGPRERHATHTTGDARGTGGDPRESRDGQGARDSRRSRESGGPGDSQEQPRESREHREARERRETALRCAGQWGWPVVPGAEPDRDTGCRCPAGRSCPVPGAHPHDPRLLAATRDVRMVGWWWERRPEAPVLLATGGAAPCAVSLPVAAAVWAVEELDRRGVRTGPVVAGPSRWALLVRPYELPELGEALIAREERVPTALRFHGPGGYLPMPSSRTGAGRVRWARQPELRQGRVMLPRAEWLLDVVIEGAANLSAYSERQL
ncbi:bifunctional DNA primase/polymerase [Streptomyces sp. 4N509B]|uniref:bifunctional DNA primase/polymerase n=1 Tax=Streptomyces sp. 4N509B TaxID=3457413 RepID=UPI003FD52743